MWVKPFLLKQFILKILIDIKGSQPAKGEKGSMGVAGGFIFALYMPI